MSKQEWKRLKGYMIANKYRPPENNLLGRGQARSKARGTGQVLVDSRVKPQVGLERVFIKQK